MTFIRHSLVIADVITTPDLASFSAYGVEACYQFHGYALADVASVNVGEGITGQAMSYTSQQYGSWSIVYWIIPVKLGTSSTYQRTVLYIQNDGHGVVVPATAKATGISNVAGSLSPSDAQLIQNRAFLVAFAREMIGVETGHPNHSTPTKTMQSGLSRPSSPVPSQPVDPAVSLSSELSDDASLITAISTPEVGVVDVHS